MDLSENDVAFIISWQPSRLVINFIVVIFLSSLWPSGQFSVKLVRLFIVN